MYAARLSRIQAKSKRGNGVKDEDFQNGADIWELVLVSDNAYLRRKERDGGGEGLPTGDRKLLQYVLQLINILVLLVQ